MLKIRLRRMGARHSPFYRVVVSDSRSVPTAAAVEELGHYDPTSNPARVEVDAARVSHWVSKGAQLSPTVKKLVANARPAAAPAGEPVKPKAGRKGGGAAAPAPAAEGNA